MSSLPKRSSSNCSYNKGEDQISVRRLSEDSKDVEGRKSGVESIRSDGSSQELGDISTQDSSCALRHFPKHKSSHLRFLAWVAYTRKYAIITDEERRTCPLLWCRMEFSDQETMLKHVWNCPHLSKGLYWCFHCQRHERLGKFHKRCSGQPSKADRIASVAKKIFSKLGAGSHKKSSYASSIKDPFAFTENWKSNDLKSSKGSQSTSYSGLEFDYPVQELSDTSIVPEMAGDWTAACQELPDTSIFEVMGPKCNNGLESADYGDNFYAENFDESDLPSRPTRMKPMSPKLHLDTSMSPLHAPSRWDCPAQLSQLVSPAHSAGAPFSSDIVSPLSAIGTYNPTMAAIEVSPTDTIASGQSFFTDSGYTSGMSNGSFSRVPSFNDPKGTKRTWDCAAVAEEHLNDLSLTTAPLLYPVSLPDFEQAFTDSLNSTPSVSRSSSSASDKSRARDYSPHWSDAATLVQSFSEVLDAHISHSKSVLRDMLSDSVTAELLALSKSTLVSIGIEVLAGIFEGRNPTSVVQLFAFAHIAYACAISMNSSNGNVRSNEWFQDVLHWVGGLSNERQRAIYTDIVTTIWQPQHSLQAPHSDNIDILAANSNRLTTSCQNFLDILEKFDNEENESVAISNSNFNFAQTSFEIRAKSRVLDRLIMMNTIEAFIGDVVMVEKKLLKGYISNTRGLELELICAAKLSTQSSRAYTRFTAHVSELCDVLYAEESNSLAPRTPYYIRDISIFKRYLPEDVYGDVENSQDDIYGLDLQLNDEDLLLDFDFEAASREVEDGLDEMNRSAPAGRHDSFNLTPSPATLSSRTPTPLQLQMPVIRSTAASTTPRFSGATASTSAQMNSHSIISYDLSGGSPVSSRPTSSIPEQNSSCAPSSSHPPNVSISPPTPPPSSNKYTCHCGYTPLGEEKWKPSNLRRHKRTQHATDIKVYKCRWPGCKSEFTRSDNLRSHQREKGHAGMAGLSRTEDGDSAKEDTGRPGITGKRRRVEGSQ